LKDLSGWHRDLLDIFDIGGSSRRANNTRVPFGAN
jgi:hypothetical protein